MKLTDAQVLEIFQSQLSTRELAANYGVSTFTIRAIKRRHSRADITGQYGMFPLAKTSHKHIMTDEMVIAIYKFTGSISGLKRVFGVSKTVANNIKFRHTYTRITEDLGPPGELMFHSLTWDDVCTIRASTLDSATLAHLFNVSKGTIYNIRSGRTRKFK